jgi:hypothetical protein
MNRITQAYATLPLRMLSELYRCAPGYTSGQASCDPCAIVVEPHRLCFELKPNGSKAMRIKLIGQRSCEDVEVTLGDFKDESGKVVAACDAQIRDDLGNFQSLSRKSPFNLELDECECQTLTLKVTAGGTTGCFTARLTVEGDTQPPTKIKVEVSIRA